MARGGHEGLGGRGTPGAGARGASGAGGGSRGGGVVKKSASPARRTPPPPSQPITPTRGQQRAQNTVARTYITPQGRTPAQQRADSAASARMKAQASKGRTFNKAVGTAGAGGTAGGFVAGGEVESRRSTSPTKGQRAAGKRYSSQAARAAAKGSRKGK